MFSLIQLVIIIKVGLLFGGLLWKVIAIAINQEVTNSCKSDPNSTTAITTK